MGDEGLCSANVDGESQPDGKPATIHFIQVGGRTTALVEELQKMPEGVDIKPKVSKGGKGSRGGKAKAEREDGSVSLCNG